MILNVGLALDFGNSETRVALITQKKVFRYNMSNRFAEVDKTQKIRKKYVNDKSTIFDFNGSYFANGQLVELEYTGLEERPSALESKTSQLVTRLTLNLAIIKAYKILAIANNVPVTSLEVTFNISTLLPPLDHEMNEDKMKAIITELKSVTTYSPQHFVRDFKIGDVNIYSEAVAAFFGTFFQETYTDSNLPISWTSLEDSGTTYSESGTTVSLTEVEANKKFMSGYVLVLDIGAGTTDVALFKDMELLERSKATFNKGGNMVESIIQNEFKKKYGYSPEPDSMSEIVQHGMIVEGSETIDVSDIVTSAKDSYSKAVMEDIRKYLERIMIDMPVIKGLLVAGGGSLPSVYDGQVVSPAMSGVLMAYLNRLAPRLAPVETEGKNLRELNIDGLIFMHKYA